MRHVIMHSVTLAFIAQLKYLDQFLLIQELVPKHAHISKKSVKNCTTYWSFKGVASLMSRQ